jgi:two-component system, OmpR family, sensor histidine kinase TctE
LRVLAALALLELALLVAAALFVPLVIRRKLAPLREEMEARRSEDLARLEGAMVELKRFTGDASHQMRTPLTILRTHLAVLRREGTGSALGARSLDDVEAATARLERLLTQLLGLARAEGAAEDDLLLPRATDMVALARRVAEEQAPIALKRGIEIAFEAGAPMLLARTVDSLAVEMLANLVDNAIRYNRPGGELLVTVRAAGKGVEIAVEDDGPGIAPAERELVFARFFRGSRHQAEPGSGLGLAIVRAIADSIGAEVRLGDRAAGTGLCAVVRFPGVG